MAALVRRKAFLQKKSPSRHTQYTNSGEKKARFSSFTTEPHALFAFLGAFFIKQAKNSLPPFFQAYPISSSSSSEGQAKPICPLLYARQATLYRYPRIPERELQPTILNQNYID
ncbi:hypothetical protein [Rufibacter sp. XAAS-G3-1]|uniref:hypothetical protein n=1 Tax=Rufibacter sp. XAAS-G3-1 TaxID=2729134 RepID=UPI0015E701B5|nr:hypothetical protein [Rufibacter sp. XAAS-G3-1]